MICNCNISWLYLYLMIQNHLYHTRTIHHSHNQILDNNMIETSNQSSKFKSSLILLTTFSINGLIIPSCILSIVSSNILFSKISEIALHIFLSKSSLNLSVLP